MIIEKRVIVIFLALFLPLFSFVGISSGGALENNAIGIKAATMACSFAGLADDASAVYHNPAGLSFNKKNIWYGEAYVLSGISKTEYNEGPEADKSETAFHIPGFFLAKTYEKWAFGVGHYTSFAGGGVEYDDFQDSGHDREAYLGLSPFTSTAAYKITPELSLAVAFSIYTGYMGSKSQEEISSNNFAEVKTEYSGYSGYGYSMGIMYKPFQTFNVGIRFRGEFDTEIDGHSRTTGIRNGSEVDFTIPYMISIGFSYKPNSDLTFCFAYMSVPWGDLEHFDIKTQGVTQRNPSNYKDGKVIGLGVEYIMSREFKLWGGICYGACATRGTGIDAVAPDSNKIQPSIGVGWNITKSLELGISALISFGIDSEESGIRELYHDSYMLITGVRFNI